MNAASFVYPPVHIDHLPKVYALLAQLANQSGAEGEGLDLRTLTEVEWGPEEDITAIIVDRDNGPWWVEEIEELAGHLKNEAGIAMMTAIARNSLNDVWTTYADLLDAGADASDNPDFGYDHVRAQLSWIAKYSKRIKGANVWPLRMEDAGPDADRGQRYRYFMPTTLAEAWLACLE